MPAGYQHPSLPYPEGVLYAMEEGGEETLESPFSSRWKAEAYRATMLLSYGRRVYLLSEHEMRLLLEGEEA